MTLYKYLDGERVEMTPEHEQDTLAQWAANKPSLDDLKARKLREVNRAYSEAMRPISEKFPPEEREGWGEQIKGSQSVRGGQADPLIDALRRKTGETAAELADSIAAKRAEYRAVYGHHGGTLRGLRQQIEAATTKAELNAIDVAGAFNQAG